jgi:hypothetical protein
MVLVRDDGGPECSVNLPWSTSIVMLDLLANRAAAPGGTLLSEALRRSETAACLGGLGHDTMRYRVGRGPSYYEETDLRDALLSANPARNTRALLSFCDELGMVGSPACEALAEELWRKGVPMDPPGNLSFAEHEVTWVAKELLAIDTANDPGPTFVYAMYIKEHRDPNDRVLQPPSTQRLCVAPRRIAAIARAALCVYLFNYGLELSVSAAAPDWPTASEALACLAELHATEQDVETLLDAYKLTNPTWGGQHETGDVYFQGRRWLDKEGAMVPAVVLC